MRRPLALAGLLVAAGAVAQEAELPPTIVTAAPSAVAASERQVATRDLATRPAARLGELLEAAPGLVVMQHSGEGKASQYFLRGFNLDHGTDLAISVDGMPVNMRSHAHGQGYADTNFLIPETLAGMLVRKGPYAADLGDFATAGALRLDLADALPRPFVQVTGGSFGYRRGLAAGSMLLGAGTLLAAGDVTAYDGPWQRGDALTRWNGLLRYSQGTPGDGFSLTGMAHDGRWRATNQVPARAIASGLIDRFGPIDPTDGGRSRRLSLSGRYATTGDWGTTRISAYAIRSTLDLYNNFTYLLDNPDQGDQFLQRDRRWTLGAEIVQAMPWTLLGHAAETRIGVQARHDAVRLGLFDTEARRILGTVRQDRVTQDSLGLFTDTTLRWTDWLRGTAGLRLDGMAGRVRSDTAANSGYANQWIVSPKLGLVLGPWWATEFFLNAGTGFHSNDLRGATARVDPGDPLLPLARVPLLVRARGAEIGVATRLVPALDSRLAVFVLTLASEIVFQGDAGTTEPTRASRRIGIEWSNRWQAMPALAFDLDLAATRARYTERDAAGSNIPGAPNLVLAAGATWDDGAAAGWYGATRLRLFGPRPLTEDGQQRSRTTALVNARAGYRFESGWRVQLDAFNLFNARASQVDYFYTSRLAGEPAAGVADRHLHPVEPLAVRVTLAASL